MKRSIFSIAESPAHPDFAGLYARLGLQEFRLTSMRKALQELKQTTPDIVVADFIYGYGNNYAGVNISNLDVFLYSLQRHAPDTRIIVLVEKSERHYVDKLAEILPLHAVLIYPISEAAMQSVLE